MIRIFEDKTLGKWTDDAQFKKAREEIMEQMYGDEAEEKIKRVDFYLSKYLERRAELDELRTEWEDIDALCGGDREANGSGEVEAFVNVMIPNLEGQIAAMTNYNIAAAVRGVGVGDQMFVKTAEPIVDFIIKRNNIRKLVKDCGRPYLKYGNTFTTVSWDPEAFNGMGMPRIKCRGLADILLDGKTRTPDMLEEMDYYIDDVGQKSILWAARKYGDEIAAAIQTGNSVVDFQEEFSMDDEETFTLLRVWTKMNETGNMQMLLMSSCGILLEESDESEQYYSRVFNRFNLFYAGLYPAEGAFYHYGDGRLLSPIQKLINKLYDEVLIAIKFASLGRTYADPRSKISVDEFAENDPSKPIMCDNPRQNIYTVQGPGINEGVYRVLADLFSQVEKVTRFSALMTGQQGSSKTATEAGILMQQGATGVDDKKADLSKMLSDAVLYAFALCLENWSAAVALRVTDNDDDFVWVEPQQLTNIPKMIPASAEYQASWRKKYPKLDKEAMPKWIQPEVENEESPGSKTNATGQIMLDLNLTIGEGMPTNKVSMYNILLSLSQLTVIDEETMQPVPLMTRKRFTDMLEEILGLELSEDEEGKPKLTPVQQKTVPPINQDANVPNANARGIV